MFSSLFTFTFTHCLIWLGHHILCIAASVCNHSQGVIDVSVKSTIKRSLHEWKYKRFMVQTMGYTQQQEDQTRLCQKNFFFLNLLHSSVKTDLDR